MNRLKQIALFFLMLSAVSPAFASVVSSPLLSVVQRETEIRLIFSWEEEVDFSEKTDEGRYRLSFPVRISGQSPELDQIRSALPARWRRILLRKEGKNLLFEAVLPDGGFARAERKGKNVFVVLQNIPEKESVSLKKTQEEKRKKTKNETLTPLITSEVERIPERPVSKKDSAESEKKQFVEEETVYPDVSAIPYKEAQNDVSLTLSSPQIFEKRAGKTSFSKQRDLSGYRAATLSFPWSRTTGVAAFRRDGYVWLVFDRQGDFDFTLERELYKDIIFEMIQVPHSQATIYRLVTAPGYNPSVRREGLLWIVDLMYQPIMAKKSVDLVLQRKTVFGPRIFIPLNETPQVVPLIDPEVGDLMYIIPIFDKGTGVAQARSFVDASFLQTAQGVVIIPNIEDLNVYSSTSGLEVRGPKDGMRFSSEDILAFLAQTKVSSDPLAQILDVSAWGGGDAKNYKNKLKQLQTKILQAEPENKDIQRLILARYYFANGMYPETLGVLRVIAADNKSLANLPGVLALRGASNFMMMRYDEAIKDLSSPVLKNDPAAEYWRAATLAASSRTPEVYLQTLKDNMAILQAYPYPIKTRLALAGLHAAVAGGDEFSIQNFMEAANSSENSVAENDEIAFYHALWQETTGMYSLARDEMSRLAEGSELYFRAMGGLEKVRMDIRSKAITPQERIEELERLSYAWRGGEFEYNVMTLLVAAYQEQKKFAEVLYILKDMRSRFGDTPESPKIQKLMEDIFQKLYLDDKEESVLSPVKAVALYDEFKELTPSGEKGSQIIRRLADRLVSIDLLDRAAALLEDQLKQRIGDKEKGLVSTRLALIRLLNKEPQKALDVLKANENRPFSDKLKQQRQHIQAKALADLKKTEEAAALLEEDDSEAAKMLRAEIFWQAQMWDKAADALKLLIKKPQPGVALTQQEAQRVLDWAAALRLAGRPKVVMRLRENFMPYMKETKLYQAFDFITKSPGQGLMDYRQVAQEVESAESFHTFAKEYTDILKNKGLSEAVR